MSKDLHRIDELFIEKLTEEEKQEILKSAGIQDDRPNIFKGDRKSTMDYFYASDIDTRWIVPHRKKILPLILRMKDLSYLKIGQIVSEGDLIPSQGYAEKNIVVKLVPFLEDDLPSDRKISHDETSTRVCLTDLAAASAMLSEMFTVFGAINMPFLSEIPYTPPRVQVRGGSVEFALDKGLFASGIGLIVACSAGLVASPVVGIVSGTVLASVGLIELAIGWKQKITEIRATEEEIRLRKLEYKAKEIELEMCRIRAQQKNFDMESEFAHSKLVARNIVIVQAKHWGLTEAYANIILNRLLPEYLTLRRYFKDIKIEEE